MKWISFVFAALMMCSSLGASAKKGDQDQDMFVLEGKLVEIDLFDPEVEKSISEVQIVIYQDKDIFVAFYSEKNGSYEFFLPIGHEYEIWFGGTAFVNKKVYVDARKAPKTKLPHEIELDIALFRPKEDVDFSILNEPWVKFAWDAEYASFVPDLEYTEERARELDKVVRKLRKAGRS